MSDRENPWIEETITVQTFDGKSSEIVIARHSRFGWLYQELHPNSRKSAIAPLHACCHCAYFLSGNPSICNAFHQPENYYQVNDCADWEAK